VGAEETSIITKQGNGRNVIVAGKAISLQAWAGPEGSMKLRLPDFKTVGT